MPHADVDATCRDLVLRLADGGWLRYTVPAAYGGVHERLDVRSLCLARETLAYANGLADFAFAMQGLGSGPISLFGTDEQKRRWLPAVVSGDAIAAFAISEAEAGSDAGAMTTTARRDGGGYVIDGRKTWISNAGIADRYVVFARFPEAGERGFGAFVIDADNPGLRVTERIDVTAPHPLGTVELEACRVAADARIGEEGGGMKVALGTLDVFRSTVGAAALGFARRALDEAVAWAKSVASSGAAGRAPAHARGAGGDGRGRGRERVLVYRAAWTRDNGAPASPARPRWPRSTPPRRPAVVDRAIQLLGARGVVRDSSSSRSTARPRVPSTRGTARCRSW